ncbi:nuclease-related domain-containing protein [Acidisphaera sp. L21]|uniref:nuclease-related domain-containing protein n=1 Tax=Acidisphaera sp. L21 TaxID=1641851 RepID=UPI00131A9806|nr:nuclease-related domain-containing protein [Acidisphaera sp. L21]
MVDENETATRSRSKRTTHVGEDTWTKFGEFKAAIIGRKGEGAVARALSNLGMPALHDVLLPDLLGVTQMDHLVRASDAIMVIETKTYGGHITGSLDSAEWVQHLAAGEVRHALQNPVHQNHRHCRAVQVVLAGLLVPIAGIIVSAGSATFCDDLKGRVVPLPRLAEVFRPTPCRSHDPRDLDVAWRRLLDATAAAEVRREEHQEAMRHRRKDDRPIG